MPVVVSPAAGGWIKVSPPRRNPQISKAKQEAALRGPLAYFSCQPVPTKMPTKLPPCPKYDLDEDGHPHKHRSGGGKNRTVSAPVRHGRRDVHYDDEDEDSYDDERHEEQRHRRSPPSRERSRPPAHHSPHTHTSNHRSAPTAAQPRAASGYWTGPTKKHSSPSPRSYTS